MKLHELLKLECPLVFLDCETTGLKAKFERIVQLAFVKIRPDGKTTEWQTLINPTVPIPPEISAIHGITDETVKDAPTFAALAPRLAAGLQKCDFGGHNVKFDLDFLSEEFERCGMTSPINGRVVDSQRIFHLKHPRTLTDAVRVYLGEKLERAHDALVDTRASLRVLEAQLLEHSDLPRDVGELHRKFFEDTSFHIQKRFGVDCINFGQKHVNTPLDEVARKDPGYLKWMLSQDFPLGVQEMVRKALAGEKA